MTSRLMKRSYGSIRLGILTSVISLAVWSGLAIGANFGMHPVVAAAGLIWLATVGLPTSLGVALAATVWGHFEPCTGLGGFLALSVILGVFFQAIAIRGVAGVAAAVHAMGGVLGRGYVSAGVGVVLVSVGTVLWATHRPPAPPSGVLDGHAHVFGDEGWPPVHMQTCGLSPSQKANPSYGLLTRLLRLPSTGDLHGAYRRGALGADREQDAR